MASLSGDYIIKAEKSEMIAVNWLLSRDLLINIGGDLIRYAMIRVPETYHALWIATRHRDSAVPAEINFSPS